MIMMMVAYYRLREDELITQTEEYVPDRTSRTTVYVILLLCIISIIGLTVPPFSNFPLWYGLCIPFVLFLPGYYIVNTLLPRKGQFSLLERLGGAVFISMIITSIVGLITAQYSGELDMVLVSVVMAILTFIIVIIYMIQVRNIRLEERYNHKLTNTILIIIMVIALIGIVGAGIYSTGIDTQLSSEDEGSTTFDVSGINKSANDEGYVSFSDGENLSVDMNVTNLEGKDMNYTIKVEISNDTTDKVLEEYPVSLADGESQVVTTNITMSPGQKDIKFVLYNSDNEATNIRHLYANVTD